MHNNEDNRRSARPRLLILAYHYDRAHSMESRLSWQRAQHAAEDYDTTVICARGDAANRAGAAVDNGVTTVEAPLNWLERTLMAETVTYYLGYRLWHRRVYRLAKRLHASRPFSLVHQVSFCGYREPSDCWRLDAPFVWGPVGGTRPFPLRFFGELDLRGGVRELMRNIVNDCQLRFAGRVRRAMRAASAVLAANHEVARDLASRYGGMPRVLLETGISDVRATPRPPRAPDAPLKILWSGRLRSWKGLPLLLRALGELPASCRYTLRVLGDGNCRARWRQLAERLGIAANIEWIPWPPYSEQLPHYEWADVFAFTSLRDTSGTGLLEALAAGAPIVGIDHQGAADIMTDGCAIRVPATNHGAATAGFRDAIVRLAGDVELLSKLSEGARERALKFEWGRQWDAIRATFLAVRKPLSASEPKTSAAAERALGRREAPAMVFSGSASQEALQ